MSSCCGGAAAACSCAKCAAVRPVIGDLEIPLDRVTYREGQLLASTDLRDDHGGDERRRRLHARYMHQTWGIALGFEVNLAQGQREVIVGPGYAIDLSGRDLLLAQTLSIPLPDGPAAIYVLAIRFREDTAYPRLPSPGLCGPFNPRNERVDFFWLLPETASFDRDVPLAAVAVAGGLAQGPLNLRLRRNARRMIRPHVAVGVTDAGRTGWRDQSETGFPNLWLEAAVDTSEAGFTKAPRYFVSLNAPQSGMLEPFAFLSDSSSASFVYRIPRLPATPNLAGLSAAQVEQQKWTLSWVGYEPVGGCEPAHGTIFTPGGWLSQAVVMA